MRQRERSHKKIPVYTEQQSFVDTPFGDLMIASYRDEEPGELRRVEPHRHSYYEIIWIQAGKGSHRIDFTDYPFQGPCLFLLHPQNVHTILHQEGARIGGVIKFSPSFFSAEDTDRPFLLQYGIFDDMDPMPVILLSAQQEKEVEKLFRDLQDAYRQPSSFSAPILRAYLKIFLLRGYEIKKNSIPVSSFNSPEFIRYRAFQQLLNEQFTQRHDPAFYAEALRLSPRTLSNSTQKFAGKSPSALIKDRLLLEARRLLHHSALSVKEIAYSLGFEDPSYFIRFFSKNAGQSPTHFRERLSDRDH